MIWNCGCGLCVVAEVTPPASYCSSSVPQTTPVHTLGGAQSAAEVATVQLTLHTLVAALHWNPPGQLALVAAPQVPAPSHSRAGVSTAPVGQRAATHTVPATNRRQAPAPSQVPSVPQLAAPWLAH